jgi:hypothetical protein
MKAPARSDSSASFAVIVFGIATRIFGLVLVWLYRSLNRGTRKIATTASVA